MKVLEMNGRQITNELLFRRYFSPLDLLRQRELAAGFAVQVLKPLGYTHYFNSFQLYRAVFQELPGEDAGWKLYTEDDQGGALEDGDLTLLRALWDILSVGGPAGPEQQRIFWILAAGYLLAGRTLEDTPLTRKAAEDAYERKSECAPEPDFPPIPDAGDILLPARKKPYRLILDPEQGRQRLEAGGRITPRKLVSAPHWQGCSGIPVILEIFRSSTDPAPCRMTLAAGDYLFCNFVEQIPVFLHPTTVVQGKAVMTRKNDTITITHPYREAQTIDCTGREVVSFTPEEDGCHWVLADTKRLDHRHYSQRNFYRSQLLWMEQIVQVGLGQEGELQLLDSRGQVSTFPGEECPDRKIPCPSLDSLKPNQKGAHSHADT